VAFLGGKPGFRERKEEVRGKNRAEDSMKLDGRGKKVRMDQKVPVKGQRPPLKRRKIFFAPL
jgi:hypothetical protein